MLLIGALAACTDATQTRSIHSSVEAFASDDRLGPNDRVFVMTAAAPGTETLEQRSWIALVGRQFEQRGIAVTRNLQDATAIATVGFRIDSGRDVAVTFQEPQWGVVGYTTTRVTTVPQRVGPGSALTGTTTTTPQFGVTGYRTQQRTEQRFRRQGVFAIARPVPEGARPVPIFEARLSSEGWCGLLSALAPYMAEALFATYPAGGARRVSIPQPADWSC
jgi:hypothetical protein